MRCRGWADDLQPIVAGLRENRPRDGQPTAGAAGFYAQLIGWLHRELMLAYLPTCGVYFAGTVAKAILTRPFRKDFQAVAGRAHKVSTHAHTPVFAITADAAALHGCAQMPVAQG